VQVVVAVYLVISVLLTILAPTLMLALINTAYYGFTQFLPAFLGVFFVRRFTAAGLAAGFLAGDASILLLYASGLTLAGVNIGLAALLVNFAVTFVVSSMTKNPSAVTPIATPGTRRAERSTT
jgi:solute:Na+ symporter, SSS family